MRALVFAGDTTRRVGFCWRGGEELEALEEGTYSLKINIRVPTTIDLKYTGEMARKILVRENTGNLEILPKHRENTGNLVCSSCKFPDSKGIRYFDICRENSQFYFELDKSAKSVLCM